MKILWSVLACLCLTWSGTIASAEADVPSGSTDQSGASCPPCPCLQNATTGSDANDMAADLARSMEDEEDELEEELEAQEEEELKQLARLQTTFLDPFRMLQNQRAFWASFHATPKRKRRSVPSYQSYGSGRPLTGAGSSGSQIDDDDEEEDLVSTGYFFDFDHDDHDDGDDEDDDDGGDDQGGYYFDDEEDEEEDEDDLGGQDQSGGDVDDDTQGYTSKDRKDGRRGNYRQRPGGYRRRGNYNGYRRRYRQKNYHSPRVGHPWWYKTGKTNKQLRKLDYGYQAADIWKKQLDRYGPPTLYTAKNDDSYKYRPLRKYRFYRNYRTYW